MNQEDKRKLRKLRGKKFYEGLDIAEEETLTQLADMEAQDGYWDCNANTTERRDIW
jgi:hypothetical protein